MKGKWRALAIVLAVGFINIVKTGAASAPVPATGSNTLASPESFSSIIDPQKRSAAYFTELGKVLTHQRCVNLLEVAE